jgi:integrating conjugative element protein (TIGR03749 family)
MKYTIQLKHLLIVAIAITPMGSLNANADDERRVWDNRPVPVLLPVGKEVRWIFPQDVTVQLPEEIAAKVKTLLPDAHTVYLTATEKFSTARVLATGNKDGKVYILDVTAGANNVAEDIRLEDPALVKAEGQSPTDKPTSRLIESESEDQEVPEGKPLLDPVELVLTRFAMQTLYAPSRLIPSSERISRSANSTLPKAFPFIQSTQGERFSYEVVGTWQGFGHYVTAVLVVNQSPIRVLVDLTKVRGNFSHITAQHHYVGPKGDLTDRTSIYLISDKPFNEAVLEDAYAF